MNAVEAFDKFYKPRVPNKLTKNTALEEAWSPRVGDWIKLGIQIQEGEKTRIQSFEGLVIAKKGNPQERRIRVRKVFQSVGIERSFPLRAPCIATIQILKSNRPRRAKLYYLRTRTGRAAMRFR